MGRKNQYYIYLMYCKVIYLMS